MIGPHEDHRLTQRYGDPSDGGDAPGHVEQLAHDHANARRLATGLAELGLSVAPEPETNMVLFDVDHAAEFLQAIYARNLWVNPISEHRFRAVTHRDVSAADIDDAMERVRDALDAQHH